MNSDQPISSPNSDESETPIVRSEAVEAMLAKKFRIAGDVVASAVTKSLESGLIADEEAKSLFWFAGYCRDRNLDPDEVGKLLQKPNGEFYSWDSVYQVLTGRRQKAGANIRPVVEIIHAFRLRVEPTSRLGNAGFVSTGLSREIFRRLDRARERHRIQFIYGDSQIGKSENIAEYTRQHNHGQTVAIDMPARATLMAFKGRLAQVLALGQIRRPAELDDRIFDCFHEGMLLLIDNAHRALRRINGYLVFDFIQQLYDACGIGIGIFMTNEGRDLLTKGPEKKRLEQIFRRRITPLQLPAAPSQKDLAMFAQKFGLPPAPGTEVGVTYPAIDSDGEEVKRNFTAVPLDLQKRIVNEEGLGVWLYLLEEASHLANVNRGKPITWGAVLKAYCLDRADGDIAA